MSPKPPKNLAQILMWTLVKGAPGAQGAHQKNQHYSDSDSGIKVAILRIKVAILARMHRFPMIGLILDIK